MRFLRLALVLLLAGPADAARVVVPVFKTSGPKVTQTAIPKLTVSSVLVQPTLSVTPNLSSALTLQKTPRVDVQAKAQAETGVLPQVTALVQNLPAPDAPAEQGSAALGNFFTGAKFAAVTEPPVSPSFAEAPGVSSLQPAEIAKATKKLGKVPKPRAGLYKAATAAYWAGLSALIFGLHAPYDRVAPLILGAVLGGMMGLIGQFMIGSMSRSTEEIMPVRGAKLDVPEGLRAEVNRIAADMGVPPPSQIHYIENEAPYAAVGGVTKGTAQLYLTDGIVTKTPPEQLEAILRHEFAHVKHYDGLSRNVQVWLAPVLSGVALTSGILGVPDGLIFPLFVLPLISFPFFMKGDEYVADQLSAATQGSAAPLASFFIKDADDSKAALSALSGRAFSQLTGWRRALQLALVSLRRFFLSHPVHELRVARLARLAAPAQGPAVKSIAKGQSPTEWLVNGKSVYEIGWGSFKKVVPHPDDPDYVVKIFSGFGDSMKEMRLDHERSKVTTEAGVTPLVTASGAVLFNGKPLGYMVQERVQDAVERMPDAELIGELAKVQLQLQDSEPMILRKNILYGTTLSGGKRLWLVDPDVVAQVR